jgi:hypothetical protein
LEAKIGKAVALRGNKDLDKAEDLYEELLKSNTKNPLVYINAATFHEKYAKKKDYAKAKEILDKYQQLYPEDTSVMDRLARVEESQRLEKERLEKEAEERRKEAERKKRQEKAFTDLQEKAVKARADYKSLESCAAAEEGLMEVDMYLEQVEEVINLPNVPTDDKDNFIDEDGEILTNDEGTPLTSSEKKDYVKEKKMEAIEMAGDILPFVEEAQASLDALKAECSGAPAPEGGDNPEVETETPE